MMCRAAWQAGWRGARQGPSLLPQDLRGAQRHAGHYDPDKFLSFNDDMGLLQKMAPTVATFTRQVALVAARSEPRMTDDTPLPFRLPAVQGQETALYTI
jgi:hypothetical protein